MTEIKVFYGEESFSLPTDENETLLRVLQRLGLRSPEAPCGGAGTCGKCLVEADGESVLACKTLCGGVKEVRIEKKEGLQVAREGLSAAFAADGEPGYALACDIGTTTVVTYLVRRCDGECVGILGEENPQRSFGADVISRIRACTHGQLDALRESVRTCIESQGERLCAEAGISTDQVVVSVIEGNTVMEHIFMGISPESIGVSPFTPESLFGQWESCRLWNREIACFICPAVAGYVGGDITAGMFAAELDRAHKPVLFIDIGTNGEMALGCGQDFVCCATAAGPAFEGAEIELGMPALKGAVSGVTVCDGKIEVSVIGGGDAVGICGSGLVDALAVMVRCGIVDETGCMADEDEAELPEGTRLEDDRFYITEQVYVSQADVRRLQLAKAAIAAGIEILLEEYGTDCAGVEKLLLAGGFGSYIDPESAAAIGLIPRTLLPVTQAVGNTAGQGAVCAAVSARAREGVTALRDACRYVELSTHKSFNDSYVEKMMFE